MHNCYKKITVTGSAVINHKLEYVCNVVASCPREAHAPTEAISVYGGEHAEALITVVCMTNTAFCLFPCRRAQTMQQRLGVCAVVAVTPCLCWVRANRLIRTIR